MNILVIGHSYIVDSNRQFWNQLAKDNAIEVDMIVPRKWNSNLIKKLQYEKNDHTDSHLKNVIPLDVFFKGKASFYFFNCFSLYKIINQKSYDLIFTFQETWAFSTAEIAFLKFLSKNRKSLYYLFVCQNIIKKKLFWLIPFEKIFTYKVSRILFCTNEIKKVLEWKGLKAKNDYLPFTYDQNMYQFNFREIKKIITIGYMGRLTEEKGIDCLVKACKLLKKENIEIKLRLAGGGPFYKKFDEDFIEYLGILKHLDAHQFYHQIDIFVLPSETRTFWKEQFGRVLVEAIASGTPVVGSSSGAIPEVLTTLEMNYIFQEGDPQSLASVIRKLLRDRKNENFNEKLIFANQLNIENFSNSAVAKKLLNFIRQDMKKEVSIVS